MADEEDRQDLRKQPSSPELEYSEERGYSNARPAIKDVDQASEVFDTLFDDADIIIQKAAMIRKKIDGIDPPYNPYLLQQQGKSNKSNISTGFLQTISSKVAPRLYSFVNNARYLTAVELPAFYPDAAIEEPEEIPDYQEKSRKLKEIFTRKVKQWPKWFPFIVGLANETSRFGHTFTAFTDDIEWRPTLYRLDDAQVPTGTEVLEDQVPFFGIKDELMVHEMFDKIRDREIAEEVGWEVDNVIKAIKEAAPIVKPEAGDSEDDLDYEDMNRELIPGYSNRKNVNTIKIGHLFVLEYDGRVSHWIFKRDVKGGDDKLLYKSESRYGRMSDVLTVFTFEFGNGRVHGSYGVGHQLYDLAVGVEKARNSAIDNFRNRGKIQIKVDGGASALTKAKVIHHDDMTIISGADPVGSTVSLPDVTESMIAMDNWFINMAEQKIGAYTPPPRIPGVNTTATQESITAQRENEERRTILEFWLKNVSVLMHSMARRMFNPESTDAIAQEASREARAQGITERDLEVWRNANPHGSLIDLSEMEGQKVAGYIASLIGNPLYDQYKLEYDKTANIVGTEYADRWLIPQEDQTRLTEASRQQIMEINSLEKGIQVPVSDRDAHMIHMQILRGQKNPGSGFFDNGAISGMLAEMNMEGAQATFAHYMEHFEIAQQQEILGEQINVEREFQGQFQRAMQEIQRQAQNEGQQAGQNQQLAVDG